MRMLWAIASLTMVWGLCGPLSAQPIEAAQPKPRWQSTVKGSGKTEETAKKVALREAILVVDGLRKQQDPHAQLTELPTEKDEELFRKRFFVDEDGAAGEDVPVDRFVDREPHKQWIYTLRPETERLVRAEVRQTLSAIGMIGISLVLLAGVGYIRLDEYTHRRYTTWLRLAGLGVVTSAIAGWWAMGR